jgi:iron(III) transport system ATP-binding protein
MRIIGATVISAPASTWELGFTDRVIVLDQGRIAQDGTFTSVYLRPASKAVAIATGDVNVIPVNVRGNTVDSVIGQWTVERPPFEGEGIALARPEEFVPATKGEESDLIFGIEEAAFHGDHWLATGFLTGAFRLRVALPRDTAVHKGRLLPLRYDPTRFTLLNG